MNPIKVIYFIAALLLGSSIGAPGKAQIKDGDIDAAKLFREAKFAEAEKACEGVLAKAPNDFPAILLKGRIALLANRLDEAQRWLTNANKLKPKDKRLAALLAEAFYRRDDFQQAAVFFRAAGKETVAGQLESFKGLVPYQINNKDQVAHVKFIHTDPLPLISVKANGSEAVNFIIDTGGSEVTLDTEFAKKIGAKLFGQEAGTFAGGKQAPVGFGRIDSLTLGEMEVKNVPVHVIGTQAFSSAANGKPVSGVLGTALLYHFLATMDYPGGELILQPRDKASLERLEQRAKTDKQIVIPFWMSGNHFMVAWGKVSRGAPVLLFVDTGLAGGGYTGPRSVLDEAGVKVSEERAGEGVGGGGKIKIVPFELDELALGEARERNVNGIFGPFPPTLEYSQGFRIGGIISHQFFRPYTLSLDFTGMRFFLKRSEVSSTATAPAPVSSASSPSSSGQESRFTAMAQKLVAAINAADYEAIVSEFSQQMLNSFPREKAKTFFQGLTTRMGKIEKIDAPRLLPPEQALFMVHFERGALDIKLILNDRNQILGLGFIPIEKTKDKEEIKRNETQLRLPFNGRWLVDWGGDKRELNTHHDAPNQVYAFDFVGVGPDGKTSTGDGARNEDYYAFGREVVAGADGIVTDVIEGVRDNQPGSINPYSALGNSVTIEHRRGEVSFYAHLKLGSTRVKAGDRVKAGQVIGLCGNSGGSRKPHLHYHLQQTPVIQDGKGIKVYFQNFLVSRDDKDDKTERKEQYSPIRGEVVSPG